MHSLIEHSDNCSKTSWSLWNYYSDKPFLNANGGITDLPADNNNSVSFKFKTKIAGRIEEENDDTKNVKTRVPLNFFEECWNAINWLWN